MSHRTVTVAWGRRQHKVSIPERATTADLCCALRELTSKDMSALVLKPHGGRGYLQDDMIIDYLTHFEVANKADLNLEMDVLASSDEDIKFEMPSLLTPEEAVMDGLLSGKPHSSLLVKRFPGDKGRGVVATNTIPVGSFLCEYKTGTPPYPRKQRAAKEAEYIHNNEGCYILEVQCRDGRWLCFDATRRTQQYGRYMNHTSASLANAKPLPPFLVNGKLRVGFVTIKPIKTGDELLWDYGVSPQGVSWLQKKPQSSSKDPSADQDGVEHKHSKAIQEWQGLTAAVEDSQIEECNESETPGREITGSSESTPHDIMSFGLSFQESVSTKESAITQLGTEKEAPTMTPEPAKSSDLSQTRKLAVCPVCGRADLPQAILAAHAWACAEEKLETDGVVAFQSKDNTDEVINAQEKGSHLGTSRQCSALPKLEESGLEEEVEEIQQPSTSCGYSLQATSESDYGPSPEPPERVRSTSEETTGKLVETPLKKKRRKRHLPKFHDEESQTPETKLTAQARPALSDVGKRRKGKRKRQLRFPDSDESQSDSGLLPKEGPKSRKTQSPAKIRLQKRLARLRAMRQRKKCREMAKGFILDDEGESKDCTGHGNESDDSEVGTDEHIEISSDEAPKRKKYKDKRYRKWCPVIGCQSRIAHKKLIEHLHRSHEDIPYEERRRLAKNQPRVPRSEGVKKRVQIPRGQTTLTALFQPRPIHGEEESSKEPEVIEEPCTSFSFEIPKGATKRGSTRHFPKFDIEQQPILRFRAFLESIDGKLKSRSVAKSIATDVSKFLRFATTGPTPDWATTYNRQLVVKYLEKMKTDGGCSHDSQLVQLESLTHALRYIQCKILDEADPANNTVVRMETIMQGWKASLRKKRAVKLVERMEEFASTPSSLDEITEFIECQEMWKEYRAIVKRIREGKEVPPSDVNFCSVAVGALLLYSSWQRPGAVENCTIEEFQASKTEEVDGSVKVVISVKHHKTGTMGPANLVFSADHMEKLLTYVEYIRPQVDPESKSPYLFVRAGGEQLTQLSNRIKAVGKKFGIKVPTATRVRKIASTVTALHCRSSSDTKRVTKQMCHSASTHEKYYEAVGGSSQAAQAHEIMESLRKGEGKADSKPKKAAVPRRPFKKEEEDKVREYFAPAIQAGSTPSLRECAEFLHGSGIDRNGKQIQDKVKNLIKHQ